MELIETKTFSKNYNKISRKDSVLIDKVDDALRKLASNPFDDSLRTHKLKGNLTGLYSSRVTDDVRIIFDFVQMETGLCVLLLTLGKHDEVYK